MELTNDFEVAVPVDEAWAVLTDIERIAPCMPGAQLQEVEGDEYRGVVKVKVGPITAQYKGTATFVEKDDDTHVAVLKADGRDTRGQGNANAVITAKLEPAGERTKVSVHTDLTVTGKVAQFGRGVMADVSAKLLDQFVTNLETTVLAGNGSEAAERADTESDSAPEEPEPAGETESGSVSDTAPAAAGAHEVEAAEEEAHHPGGTDTSENGSGPAATSPGVRKIEQPEPEPVDLIGTAGAPVVKRVLPAVGVLVVLYLLWRWLSSGGDD
jgi:carbon monoxide dehydrogenase subunit G